MVKIIFVGLLGLIGFITFGIFLRILFFPSTVINKQIDTAYDAVSKTINADNAIYNYEWFKRQKESIDATVQKLLIANKAVFSFEESAGIRQDWTFEDKNEDARLRSIAQGVESILKDMIAEYNARSKMANRNIFSDGILPSFMDSSMFIFKP